MSDAPGSKPEVIPDPEVERAGRTGRNVALGIYLLGLVYIVVVGFVTTISGVFAAPTSEERALARDGSCDSIRVELATALRDASSRYVLDGNRTENQRFLVDFDHRYHGLRARCDDASTRELGTLRHRVEIQLRRFEHENASIFDRLAGSPRPTSSPESPR